MCAREKETVCACLCVWNRECSITFKIWKINEKYQLYNNWKTLLKQFCFIDMKQFCFKYDLSHWCRRHAKLFEPKAKQISTKRRWQGNYCETVYRIIGWWCQKIYKQVGISPYIIIFYFITKFVKSKLSVLVERNAFFLFSEFILWNKLFSHALKFLKH